MSLFSLFSCKSKVYEWDEDFLKKEKRFKLNLEKVNSIYNDSFTKNFSFVRDKSFDEFYSKVVYIENDSYYIGLASTLDKRGVLNPNLKYLIKINGNTGEISVVK